MKYNYEKDPCRCPKCHRLGMPWMGYFTCEDCGAIYLIETGQEVKVINGIVKVMKNDLPKTKR